MHKGLSIIEACLRNSTLRSLILNDRVLDIWSAGGCGIAANMGSTSREEQEKDNPIIFLMFCIVLRRSKVNHFVGERALHGMVLPKGFGLMRQQDPN